MMKDFIKKNFLEIQQDDYSISINRAFLAILFVFVLFFASEIIAGFVILIYPEIRGFSSSHTTSWLNQSIIGQFFYILLTEIIVVGSTFLYLKRRRIPLKFLGLRKFQLTDIFYALLAVPFFYASYILIVELAVNLNSGLNVSQKQHIGFNSNIVHGPEYLIFTFISLVILPPIAEEIMFRGFLLGNLRKILPLIPAIILTSVLFALPHLFEGGKSGLLWIAAIDTFILSIFLIILRLKTKGIYASIFLHAINNLIAFIAIYLVKL